MSAIVFAPYFRQYEGRSDINGKEIPAGMNYTVKHLADLIVAAAATGGHDAITTAVGPNPKIVDVGTPLAGALMEQKGLARLPAKLPANADYWKALDERIAAQKAGTSIEVKESVHISKSCSDPHLTIIVKDNLNRQIGQNIHICVTAIGTEWQFARIHP